MAATECNVADFENDEHDTFGIIQAAKQIEDMIESICFFSNKGSQTQTQSQNDGDEDVCMYVCMYVYIYIYVCVYL